MLTGAEDDRHGRQPPGEKYARNKRGAEIKKKPALRPHVARRREEVVKVGVGRRYVLGRA